MGQARNAAETAADQRCDNAYLFGAICPARGVGAALALPCADADMMQLHLDEISRNVAAGAHAVLLLDRAGLHTAGKLDLPKNITPIFLPSRAPELNPVENVWQYLRQNGLSNTVFENYDAMVDAACAAWRNLIAHPETIASIGTRDWAHVGQPLSPLVSELRLFKELRGLKRVGVYLAIVAALEPPEQSGAILTCGRPEFFIGRAYLNF